MLKSEEKDGLSHLAPSVLHFMTENALTCRCYCLECANR